MNRIKRLDAFFIKIFFIILARARLTIGQTGQMPGASRWNIKTLLYWFFMFLGSSPRVTIVELLIITFSI